MIQRSINKKILFLFAALFFLITFSGCSLKASNRYYNSALKEYEKGNYEKAEINFQKAIKENPQKAEFYLDYGFNLIKLARYEEAAGQFQYAVIDKDIKMIKENNKRAYRGIGIAYYSMQQYEEAIKNFDLALSYAEASDLNADILSYKGSAMELLGQYEAAAEVYTAMIQDGKNLEDIYRIRGDIYRKLGRYEESIADYNKAISLKEDDFYLYFGKFSVLKELGREEEAAEALKKAGGLPVYTDAEKADLAKVHFYQGNYETAKMEFEDLVNKGVSEGYFFLGEISLSEGDYQAALGFYETYVLEGNLTSAMLYNQMLACTLKLKEFEKAKDYLNSAKQLKDASINRQLKKNEIIYLEYTGDFKGALFLMEEYISEYPEEEGAYEDYIFLKSRIIEAGDS